MGSILLFFKEGSLEKDGTNDIKGSNDINATETLKQRLMISVMMRAMMIFAVTIHASPKIHTQTIWKKL